MIQFFFENDFTWGDTDDLSEKVEALLAEEGKISDELNYIFCDDDYLLEINKKYLNHDYYTDIITFDYSEGDELSGDIYISTERVEENSDQEKVHFTEELYRVVFHGALHLCGYNDKNEEDQKLMREKEDYYLNLHFKK